MKVIRAWHFTSDRLRDGRPIPKTGEWLVHDGPVEPCVSGLHASRCPLDALKYAPGTTVHRVDLRGELTPHGDPIDKYTGRERRILWSLDATPVLLHFARLCALDVIDLWDAPDIMVRYLRTGDKSLLPVTRDAARYTARYTARYAAGDAARYAAWCAAGYAAWDGAKYAAWCAARAARIAEAVRVRERQSRRLHRMLMAAKP